LDGGSLSDLIASYNKLMKYFEEFDHLMPGHNEPWLEKDLLPATLSGADSICDFRKGSMAQIHWITFIVMFLSITLLGQVTPPGKLTNVYSTSPISFRYRQNLNFAIPATAVADLLKRSGPVTRLPDIH
jgi:hypothetical protein